MFLELVNDPDYRDLDSRSFLESHADDSHPDDSYSEEIEIDDKANQNNEKNPSVDEDEKDREKTSEADLEKTRDSTVDEDEDEKDREKTSEPDLEDGYYDDSYKDRLKNYQKKTGLAEAIQTGIGKLKGIRIAIGFMDFRFQGGSMGSAVGEKITLLIEFAIAKLVPLIIVCASGGARMQEGSLSLVQMGKISAALHVYRSKNRLKYPSKKRKWRSRGRLKKLLYTSILTSPTTGGVTASFGMLGDVIIAEPNAYIAFTGKRVIEETLHVTMPEGSQEAEYLFEKGLFNFIVPRKILKEVLSHVFDLHKIYPSAGRWKPISKEEKEKELAHNFFLNFLSTKEFADNFFLNFLSTDD
uniref:Acetyl-CoA carboxylase beta subunit n=1 Tax=Drosera peltata TaxID=4369 RepID=A0A8F3FP53_DROPA|nr:acetyl-CoA carboxylase beta subunit [Drosera peltata]